MPVCRPEKGLRSVVPRTHRASRILSESEIHLPLPSPLSEQFYEGNVCESESRLSSALTPGPNHPSACVDARRHAAFYALSRYKEKALFNIECMCSLVSVSPIIFDLTLLQDNEATKITGKLVCTFTLAALLVLRHSKTVP